MPESPSPAEFTELLLPAVRQAAAIALALEGRVANRPKAGEASDVKAALTIADSAAQEAILVPLHAHFPDVTTEAEEATPTVARFPTHGPARVVVDPIDGTLRSYLEGRGPYAVMVGLAVHGSYEAALVALPREGLVFEGVRGRGTRVAREEGPLAPAALSSDGRRVLVSHGMPEAARARLREQGFAPEPACGGAVAVAPLLPGVCGGLRWAPGSVSTRGRVGALIAREAGAVLRDERGDAFPGDLDTPARALLVARDEATAAALARALDVLL